MPHVLLAAAALALAAAAVPSPTPIGPTVSLQRLRELEASTFSQIEQLQAQLNQQQGVLAAVRFLLREAEATPTATVTATPAATVTGDYLILDSPAG